MFFLCFFSNLNYNKPHHQYKFRKILECNDAIFYERPGNSMQFFIYFKTQVDKRNHVRTTCRCLVMAQLLQTLWTEHFWLCPTRPSPCDSLWRHTRSLMGTFVQRIEQEAVLPLLQFYLFPGINISLSRSISEINTPVVCCSHCQELTTDPTVRFMQQRRVSWFDVFLFFPKELSGSGR